MNNSVMPMEDRHLSSSLIEKIIAIKNNSLTERFYNIYKTPSTGKGIKNVTINKSGEMTFLPKGKASVLETGVFPNVWKKDNRQSGSFGKVLRKLLIEYGSEDVNASELEEVVNVLKGHYTVEGEFIVVSGSDISHYYLGDNYDYDGFNLGTLESSCMRHSGACQDATEFYADNPDTCEMVVLRDPERNRARARALVWTDVNGAKWMDRVYACDHIVRAFHEFAKSKGWGFKSIQDSCSGEWVDGHGDQGSHTIKIDMNVHHDILPYMDSMYYVYSSFISNSDEWGTYDRYAQTEPDEQSDNEWDGYDDCYIDCEEAIWLEYRDYHTHNRNVTHCEIEDGYFLTDDCVELHDGTMAWNEAEGVRWISSANAYYHEDDLAWCEYNDEDYPSDKVEYIDDLGISCHISNINNAFEDAGWIQNEDGDWVDGQYELEV